MRRLSFLGKATPLLFLHQLAKCGAFSVPQHASLHLESRIILPSTLARSKKFLLDSGRGLAHVRRISPLPRQEEGSLRALNTAISEESPAVAREGEGGFQWRRQWYPVGVMRDLEAMDPRQPIPVKLLGEDLVAWKEPKTGEWNVFLDRCPHRWAPLSEGRVDQQTGRLQCVYHGWEFEGDGRCATIPQASPKIRDSAQNSPRACATAIPTTIVQGKLWAWPDGSPEGVRASEASDPVIVEEIDQEDFGGEWFMRELPYGYDTLLENLADPAHIPFAHHGVMSNRGLGTVPMGLAMEQGLGVDEFRTKKTGFGGSRNLVVGFEAPSLIYYRSDVTETLERTLKSSSRFIRTMAWLVRAMKIDRRLSMKPEDRTDPSDQLLAYFVGYAVPTVPGRCRIYIRSARNFLLPKPIIPRKWRNSLAAEHLRQHLVLDGDSLLLHRQERMLLNAGQQGSGDTERTFYMPTDTDAPVRAFRKWFFKRAGGAPAWAEGVDGSALGPVLSHEQALDRYESHTKHCSACSKAYAVSNKVKRFSIGSTMVLLAAAAIVPRGALALWLAGSALASSGLAYSMAKRAQRFVLVEYVHATRDG